MNRGRSGVNEVHKDGSTYEVISLGVKEVAQEFEHFHIDLLKLDIEGAEKEVFLHGSEEWLDQVDVIAVELHDRLEPGCRAALHDG